MTKEITMMFLAALMDQIEKGQILLESIETLQNDQAGHLSLHWIKPETPEEESPANDDSVPARWLT